MEVVTILGTDRLLRGGEVRLAKYTEVSPMYTGAGSVELRMYVCVRMHACDCGYTGTGVCTYVGMCVYMCQFMFSSFPHCWSYLIPQWSGRGFRTWYHCIGSALENSKGLHHTDFSVNGAPGSVQSTGLLSGLLPVGLAAGPTCLLRERLVPRSQ